MQRTQLTLNQTMPKNRRHAQSIPQQIHIPLRNLRHYFATRTYDRTKDILLVKQLLGHKKLETTMFYTQLITFTEDEEYTTKATTDSKEAQSLLDHNFTYQ